MKKIYEKPAMQAEAFVANTYCTDCSDESHSYVTYLFDCGNGLDDTPYYIHDGNGNYATIDGKRYGPRTQYTIRTWYYEPCYEHHEVTVKKGHDVIAENPDILSGYYLDKAYTTGTLEKIPVILWTNKGTNMHATVVLDPHEWQETKS
jgi:hypothetical protein